MLLFGSSLVTGAWGQRRGTAKRTSTVVMSTQTEGSLSVSLVNAADGAPLSGSPTQRNLNLGSASYNAASPLPNIHISRHGGTFVVSTTFGISLQDATQHTSSATVFAALAAPEPAYIFRLDGLKLETTPQVILNHARIGIVTPHRLEIEVPPGISEKNSHLSNGILLQVIPD